jgi:hypothetical protein
LLRLYNSHGEQLSFRSLVDIDRILLVIVDYALFFLGQFRGLLGREQKGEEPINKNEPFQVFFLKLAHGWLFFR